MYIVIPYTFINIWNGSGKLLDYYEFLMLKPFNRWDTMNFSVVHIKKAVVLPCTVLLLMTLLYVLRTQDAATKTVMGGMLYQQTDSIIEAKVVSKDNEALDVETYFRPSKLPVLNNRAFPYDFFKDYYGKEHFEITLPSDLLKTPEDTLVNYFSILREAANPTENTNTGCGTLGLARTPYPYAYKFLSTQYQEKLDFKNYLKSFEDILHINLIKYRQVPADTQHPNQLKYFVEIETIKGSEDYMGYFGYYYGFMYLTKQDQQYKIADIEFIGENYLCAPYHGWAYNAEYVVDIKYGQWCSLVKERFPTQQEGYIKKIYFSGTDNANYLFVFFQLTNGTDIEIAQYKQNSTGKWELIKIDPNKCLDKKQ